MTVIAVPHLVTANSAEVWVGSFDEDLLGRALEVMATAASGATSRSTLGPGWRTIGSDNEMLVFERQDFSGLTPGEDYVLEVREQGALLVSARFRTPPAQLRDLAPGEEATILLGSCYSQPNDPGRELLSSYNAIAASAHRPHLHILCGDQVYIDAIFSAQVLPLIAGEHELEPALRLHYHTLYSDGWAPTGLGGLLAQAGNLFLSDDHEFWNNFPRSALLAPQSSRGWKRDLWARVGKEYFSAVQQPMITRQFEFAGIEVFAADTRVRRKHRFSEFLPAGAFERLEQWVNGLSGPGILVMGQPLLASHVDETEGANKDANLTTYAQYENLVRLLLGAPHDILLLSGDVHFGRISEITLSTARNTRLIEVLSSPMALLTGAPSSFDPADLPQWPENIPTIPPRLVTHHEMISTVASSVLLPTARDHFMTLGFREDANGSVEVSIRPWRIDPARDGNGLPIQDFTTFTATLN